VARSWPAAKTHEGKFYAVAADISTPAGCEEAVKTALARVGRLDAVVHLVGGFAMDGPLHQTSVETFDQMIGINLRSAFLLFRAALPELLRNGAGRVIAVGSRPGVEPTKGLSAYAASKAGLHMLIRTLAAEVSATGITANAILPSVIDTPQNRAMMPEADFSRWVTPETIGQTLAWLLSDASKDINGALIPVYGKA
jgi:NAD(P)-dependent dehydrogenase (short-subunit alcohol dehydrogenase family)